MPKNKNISPLLKYLTAVVIGFAVFILINIILAFITVKTPYPKDNYLMLSVASIAVSSFTGSFVYCYKQRQNGLVSGLITGIIMTVLFFILYTVFSSFNLGENSLLIIPASIIPSAFAGILAVNLKHK